jgi:hypothetical protein
MAFRSHFPDFRPPGGRRAPERLQELLREVHPEAELLYAGRGVWILVKHRPNQLIRRKVERGMAALLRELTRAGHGGIRIPPMVKKEIAFRFWYWRLLYMGARPVTRYPSTAGERIHGEPGSWIAEDFRARQWRADNQLEVALKENEAAWDQETDEEAAKGRLKEYLELMHKDIHRHAFRRPIISTPGTRRVG